MIPIILIVSLIAVLFVTLAWATGSEGFSNKEQTDYDALRAKLKSKLETYCLIASFINDELMRGFMSPKPTGAGTEIPGDSQAEADKHLIATYDEMYNCKDAAASSRSSCLLKMGILAPKTPSSFNYLPCSTYMDLPDYSESDTSTPAITLWTIKDSTPDRITAEVEWFQQTIQTLQQGMSALTDPSSFTPPPPDPAAPKPEYFADAGTCSAEAMRLRAIRDRDAEAALCRVPSLASEIKRVSALLDSSTLSSALSKCKSMKDAVLKLKAQLDSLRNGTFFKSDEQARDYAKFPGGDRLAGVKFSLQQNR